MTSYFLKWLKVIQSVVKENKWHWQENIGIPGGSDGKESACNVVELKYYSPMWT